MLLCYIITHKFLTYNELDDVVVEERVHLIAQTHTIILVRNILKSVKQIMQLGSGIQECISSGVKLRWKIESDIGFEGREWQV